MFETSLCIRLDCDLLEFASCAQSLERLPVRYRHMTSQHDHADQSTRASNGELIETNQAETQSKKHTYCCRHNIITV